MAINDFASLLQLTATLSIAFVAVEYVKSFTQTLCERFFKFNRFLAKKLGACRASMVDKDTLSSLQPVYVGNNNSTRNRIEQAKRDYESIEKEIKNKEDEMTGKMTSACQARSMPSICFFISVSSFALLFSGAIENRFLHFAYYFCSIFCIASIVYLLAGWIYGEHENPRRFCNFASFRNATLGFIILASLSVVAAYLMLLGGGFSWSMSFFLLLITVSFSEKSENPSMLSSKRCALLWMMFSLAVMNLQQRLTSY